MAVPRAHQMAQARAAPRSVSGIARQRQEDRLTAYLFLLPFFVGFAVFLLYPLAQVFHISFFVWNLIGRPQYIGLLNYQHMLFADGRFWHSFGQTLYFTLLSVPPLIVLGLALALALNRSFWGRDTLRAVFFAPYVLPISAIALVFSWLLDPRYGLVNNYLAYLHIQGPQWLSSTTWAMPTVAGVTVWWTVGFNMVMFLAGLQSISSQYYEAAAIDGAGRWATFRYITLPLLRGTLELVTLLQLVASLQIFNQVYLLTGGGPYYSTEVLLEYMYEKAFQDYHLGYASAIAVFFFAMVIGFSILQFRVIFGRGGERGAQA